MRAPASLGVADVVALRADRSGRCEARLIEVKSTAAGPYAKFGPASRKKLRETAEMAGAQAYLCWWPKRKEPVWIHSTDWPDS
jgi:Holliday junction resolvase